MAEVAPAPAPAAAKAAKKKVSRPKKAGPSVGELIVKAVAASKERSGVSAAAVKKALTAGGYDVEKNKSRVNTTIKSLVTRGTLVQTKGTGASGSYKMSKTAVEKPAKKAAPTVKKPAAKKPAAAKKTKTAAVKKPAAAAKKSPKKAKKPAAAKKTKTAAAKKPAAAAKKSPKKAKKPSAAKETKTAAVKKHVCVMQPMGDGLSFSCMADCR
ncbi:histone H1-like [Anarrhichthys ocellatus]|uniref:histone H1-like n=1 Tax=Anarrhichthys ocellatus TaxID=433405 RepID=UPI0012ED37D3|nr:histone H1-like [Anarrhichthys ocellatus]